MTEWKKGFIAGLDEVLRLKKEKQIWDIDVLIESVTYARNLLASYEEKHEKD